MLVHVGSQDWGLGTPSRYLAGTISWNAYKLLLQIITIITIVVIIIIIIIITIYYHHYYYFYYCYYQAVLEASPEGIISLFDEMRHQLLELWQ